jgi:hypothetical protein
MDASLGPNRFSIVESSGEAISSRSGRDVIAHQTITAKRKLAQVIAFPAMVAAAPARQFALAA